MPRPHKEWKVLPHDRLREIEDGILTVIGEIGMPLAKLERRMTIVRLTGKRLVIYSAIALDEDEMEFIEAYGHPTFLIVPSDLHRMDAGIWKARYPNIMVAAPEGARKKVEEVVRVDTASPDFGDPNVTFVTVPGVEGHEAALVVNTPRGTTLVLNDLVGNIHDAHGFGGWILKKAGFAGEEPQIPRVVKRKIVEDERALSAKLAEWADVPSLNRIIVSHGELIESNARETLRDLARSLS